MSARLACFSCFTSMDARTVRVGKSGGRVRRDASKRFRRVMRSHRTPIVSSDDRPSMAWSSCVELTRQVQS